MGGVNASNSSDKFNTNLNFGSTLLSREEELFKILILLNFLYQSLPSLVYSKTEPNDLGNEDVVEMLTGGKWNDLQANNNRRFIVEVTTYENIPPSEFSLIAPEDNATFALTDDLDILVDLRWQASQDPDSDVNYFVNLHGSAVVGGETVT